MDKNNGNMDLMFVSQNSSFPSLHLKAHSSHHRVFIFSFSSHIFVFRFCCLLQPVVVPVFSMIPALCLSLSCYHRDETLDVPVSIHLLAAAAAQRTRGDSGCS